MRIFAIIKKDLRTNLRDRIKLLSLIVAVLLPLAYGFLYLWAFWDPYDNMKNVPVAVVNQDAGAVYENERKNFGNQVTEGLGKNKILDWDFVDAQKAAAGLEDQKYYAVITIPEDFSAALVSTDGDDPHQATIGWRTLDSTNFLFSTYFRSAMGVLKKNVNREILPEFGAEAKVKVNELTGDIAEAGNGAKQLSSGLGQLKDGSKTLQENLDKASTGSGQLASGLGTLDSKSGELESGIKKAAEGSAALETGLESANSGIASLDKGLARLQGGAQELKDGSSQAVSGTRTLANGAQEMSDKIEVADQSLSPFYPFLSSLSGNIDSANSENSLNLPNFISTAKEQKAELVSGSERIADGSETLAEKMVTLDEGVGTLQSGIGSAKSGANTLRSGISKLSSGSSDLREGLDGISAGTQEYTDGVNSAHSGSKELSSGLAQMTDGSGKITAGLGSAQSGADTLGNKLSDGSDELQTQLSGDKVSSLISIINEPVVMKNESTNVNSTYGAGFAPYFIPLALWMGALILTLLVPTRDPKINVSKASRTEMTIGKFFLLAAVATLQALTLSLAVIYGLGLQAKYPLLLILFCVLISLTFTSIMQFLSFLLGKIGELLGIVFLMIQLTSASGTFPVESAPRFFQICNPVIPMTYAIRGLRLFILGGQMEIAEKQALMLGGFLLLFLALKTLATRKTVSATDIYPLIEL